MKCFVLLLFFSLTQDKILGQNLHAVPSKFSEDFQEKTDMLNHLNNRVFRSVRSIKNETSITHSFESQRDHMAQVLEEAHAKHTDPKTAKQTQNLPRSSKSPADCKASQLQSPNQNGRGQFKTFSKTVQYQRLPYGPNFPYNPYYIPIPYIPPQLIDADYDPSKNVKTYPGKVSLENVELVNNIPEEIDTAAQVIQPVEPTYALIPEEEYVFQNTGMVPAPDINQIASQSLYRENYRPEEERIYDDGQAVPISTFNSGMHGGSDFYTKPIDTSDTESPEKSEDPQISNFEKNLASNRAAIASLHDLSSAYLKTISSKDFQKSAAIPSDYYRKSTLKPIFDSTALKYYHPQKPMDQSLKNDNLPQVESRMNPNRGSLNKELTESKRPEEQKGAPSPSSTMRPSDDENISKLLKVVEEDSETNRPLSSVQTVLPQNLDYEKHSTEQVLTQAIVKSAEELPQTNEKLTPASQQEMHSESSKKTPFTGIVPDVENSSPQPKIPSEGLKSSKNPDKIQPENIHRQSTAREKYVTELPTVIPETAKSEEEVVKPKAADALEGTSVPNTTAQPFTHDKITFSENPIQVISKTEESSTTRVSSELLKSIENNVSIDKQKFLNSQKYLEPKTAIELKNTPVILTPSPKAQDEKVFGSEKITKIENPQYTYKKPISETKKPLIQDQIKLVQNDPLKSSTGNPGLQIQYVNSPVPYSFSKIFDLSRHSSKYNSSSLSSTARQDEGNNYRPNNANAFNSYQTLQNSYNSNPKTVTNTHGLNDLSRDTEIHSLGSYNYFTYPSSLNSGTDNQYEGSYKSHIDKVDGYTNQNLPIYSSVSSIYKYPSYHQDAKSFSPSSIPQCEQFNNPCNPMSSFTSYDQEKNYEIVHPAYPLSSLDSTIPSEGPSVHSLRLSSNVDSQYLGATPKRYIHFVNDPPENNLLSSSPPGVPIFGNSGINQNHFNVYSSFTVPETPRETGLSSIERKLDSQNYYNLQTYKAEDDLIIPQESLRSPKSSVGSLVESFPLRNPLRTPVGQFFEPAIPNQKSNCHIDPNYSISDRSAASALNHDKYRDWKTPTGISNLSPYDPQFKASINLDDGFKEFGAFERDNPYLIDDIKQESDFSSSPLSSYVSPFYNSQSNFQNNPYTLTDLYRS